MTNQELILNAVKTKIVASQAEALLLLKNELENNNSITSETVTIVHDKLACLAQSNSMLAILADIQVTPTTPDSNDS